MKLLICLMMLAAACGTETRSIAYVSKVCEHPCFKEVASEFDIECARFNKNVENLKTLYDSAGIIPEGDFCAAFKDTAILFRSEGTFFYVEDHGKIRVSGVSYQGGGIELTRDGFSLAHELLHVWDENNGVSQKDNNEHVNWGKKGYLTLTSDYWHNAYSMASEHYADEPLDKPIESN